MSSTCIHNCSPFSQRFHEEVRQSTEADLFLHSTGFQLGAFQIFHFQIRDFKCLVYENYVNILKCGKSLKSETLLVPRTLDNGYSI